MVILVVVSLSVLTPFFTERFMGTAKTSSSAFPELIFFDDILSDPSSAGIDLRCVSTQNMSLDHTLVANIVKYLRGKTKVLTPAGWKDERPRVLALFSAMQGRRQRTDAPRTYPLMTRADDRVLAREINKEAIENLLQDVKQPEQKLVDVRFNDRDALKKAIIKSYDFDLVAPSNAYSPADIAINRSAGQYQELSPRTEWPLYFKCQRPWYDCQATDFLRTYRAHPET